jgi:hypothetical protein
MAPNRIKWLSLSAGIFLSTIIVLFRLQKQSVPELHDSYWAETENKRQIATIPKGRSRYPYYGWNSESINRIKPTLLVKPGIVSLIPVGYATGIEPPKSGQITVFVVNDTNDTLEVPSQDGDIYLMLEVKLDGKWQRAQHYRSSWCGNSYRKLPLPPHSCVQVYGYSPTAGRMATCRYVINNGAANRLMSEEFEDTYSADDVALSQYDMLGLREAPLQTLKAFLLREVTPSLLDWDDSITDLRATAWDAVLSGPFDRS